MGSSLSMNQRYGNMHHGMPAHHDPPVEPNSLYLSADNLAGDKRKTRKQTMNQARKSSDMTRRRSEAKLGTLKGSNNSLSKSGSLPQISQRESLRK
jgi:hypothetical protein